MVQPDSHRSGSPLSVGRVDLSEVVPGYIFPGFAIAVFLHQRKNGRILQEDAPVLAFNAKDETAQRTAALTWLLPWLP